MTHTSAASARGYLPMWKVALPFALVVAALLSFEAVPLIGGIFFVLTTTLTTWAIYALLVLVAMLAITRRVRPQWALLPVLAFGALVSLHLLSAMAAEKEVRRVEAENLASRRTLSAPLTFQPGKGYPVLNDNLATTYVIDGVKGTVFYWDRAGGRPQGTPVLWRLGEADECKALATKPDDGHGPAVFSLRLPNAPPNPAGYPVVSSTGQCVIRDAGNDVVAHYGITSDKTETDTTLWKAYSTRYTLSDNASGRVVGVAQVEHVAIYPPLPKLLVGCIDGADSGPTPLKCILRLSKGAGLGCWETDLDPVLSDVFGLRLVEKAYNPRFSAAWNARMRAPIGPSVRVCRPSSGLSIFSGVF
ncbi:MAG: hypothetical protein ACYDD1_10335 [Caulobacteraceae bacterium]